MNSDHKFFVNVIANKLSTKSKIKFSDIEHCKSITEYLVFKTECVNYTFFIVFTLTEIKVILSKNDKFSITKPSKKTDTNSNTLSINHANKVAELILEFVKDNLLQELIEAGAFGFTLIGVQKLSNEVKLSFLVNDYDGFVFKSQSGTELEKHIYYPFDSPEGELALILLNISGNGNIDSMVTRFILSPNSTSSSFNLDNGGVKYELTHSVQWAIAHGYYKVNHLKK